MSPWYYVWLSTLILGGFLCWKLWGWWGNALEGWGNTLMAWRQSLKVYDALVRDLEARLADIEQRARALETEGDEWKRGTA